MPYPFKPPRRISRGYLEGSADRVRLLGSDAFPRIDTFLQNTVSHDESSVHENVAEAFRVNRGVLKGGFVDDRSRIEYRNVCVRAHLDPAFRAHRGRHRLQSLR